MKIVHIEDFVHPDAGYQLNSLAPLQHLQGHDVTIVTGEMDKIPDFLTNFFGRDNIEQRDRQFTEATGVKIVRVPLFGFYSGRAIFQPSLFKRVSEMKPDVAFVHGEDTLTGIVYIWISRWLRYPLVFDCHMLEMASVNRYREVFRSFYRTFVTPVLLREKIPLIRVVPSDFVEKCLAIPLEYTDLLSFGTDTIYFSPNAETRSLTRKKYGIAEDSFVVLYAGKIDEHKGGKFLAESLKMAFPQAGSRKIEFIVVGTGADEYGRQVEQTFAQSENKIVRLPTQKFRDLAQFYQTADLCVFPRQCSMSFFEVQSCAVPILFEDNEINRMRVTGNNAFLFEPGNVTEFRQKILEIANMPAAQMAICRHDSRDYVIKNYDYVPIAQQFTAVLQRAMDQWKARGRRTFKSG